jgi:hypothetical protein
MGSVSVFASLAPPRQRRDDCMIFLNSSREFRGNAFLEGGLNIG